MSEPSPNGPKRGKRATIRALLVHCAKLLVGVAAIAWAITVLPVFWRQSLVERVATRIINWDTIKPDALLLLLPAIEVDEQDRYCRPVALRSAAVVRLRLVEEALSAANREAVDQRFTKLRQSLQRSLGCTPADPFLWAVLAWLDNTVYGLRPTQLRYLRLSYQLGPNEGWVAARRNQIALSMFERLPPDLGDTAVKEFSRMVDSWLYWEAIANFTGPGWPVHERLLASLKDVGILQRESFAKALYERGYDLTVPGIPPIEPRPWH